MSEPLPDAATFEAAMSAARPAAATTDQLCMACVELLDVDGAALSLTHHGELHGTYGASDPLGRQLDEFQFTYGEGPCLDAVSGGRPVLVPEIATQALQRWPAYSPAVLDLGINSVFALPVTIASTRIGVLDLFRRSAGPLSPEHLRGGLLAARLAVLPLLDLMAPAPPGVAEGDELVGPRALERVEVYQATGMLMEQLGVGPAEALLRLRAHAFAAGTTASEVAWAVVERRLVLDTDAGTPGPDADGARAPGDG